MSWSLFVFLSWLNVIFLLIALFAYSPRGIANILKNVISRVINFIKTRAFNIILSLLLFILLLLPFKIILPLLNLGFIFPIITGFYSCIFITVLSLVKNYKELFNCIQLLYIFTSTLIFGYALIWFRQFELLYFLSAFAPIICEGNPDGCFISLPNKLAFFMEGSNSPSPPSNSPLSGFGPGSTPSPPITPALPTLEQTLWARRCHSLQDAKALDTAKRILLNKICAQNNLPNCVQMCIQDHIWGNHWYELYVRHNRSIQRANRFRFRD